MEEVLLQGEQVTDLVEFSYDLIAQIDQVRILLGVQRLGRVCGEVVDSVLQQGLCACLRIVSECDVTRLGGELRASVLAHVGFHKRINQVIQFGSQSIGRNVTSVPPGLPVIDFDLIAQGEQDVDHLCGHLFEPQKRKYPLQDKMQQQTYIHHGVPYTTSKPVKQYRKMKKVVAVDSRDRIFASGAKNANGDVLPLANDYTVQFPEPLKNVYSVRLLEAEIPTSFHAFNSEGYGGNPCSGGVNAYGLISFSSNGTVYTATLTNGTFAVAGYAAFKDAVIAALNAATDGTGTAFTGTFTGTVSTTNGRLTLSCTVPYTLLMSSLDYVLETNSHWGLGYFLGFQKRDQVADLASGSYVLQSQYPMILNPYPHLFMELEFINKGDELSIENNRSGDVNNFFAKIPLTEQTMGRLTYFYNSSVYDAKTILTPPMNKLQTLHVSFHFHDRIRPNFNNAEHSFLLEFELLDSNFDEYSSLEVA